MQQNLKNNSNKVGRQTPLRMLKHHSIQTELFTLPPAGISSRFFAFLIDSVFFSVISETLCFLFLSWVEPEGQQLVKVIILCLTYFSYFVFPLRKWGYTPGKKALGLRVLPRVLGSRLTLRNLIFREYLGVPLSFCTFGLGYLMGVLSKEKLTLHDRLFSTKVVQEELNESHPIARSQA